MRVAELDERDTPADVVGAFAGLGEAQQQQPARALFVGGELPVGVLGEPGHRAADPARVVIAGVGEDPAAAAHPGLQQRRGQQRERARLAGHVGGDRVGEPGFERQRRPVGGFLDRGVDLGVGHRSDEQLTLGDQPRERRAHGEAAVVVRPERDHDGGRAVGRGGRSDDRVEERGLRVVVATGGEQLLQVVHHQCDPPSVPAMLRSSADWSPGVTSRCPSRGSREARLAATRAGSPARTSDDLPLPEGPTTATNRDTARRATSSSTSRSRPQKNASSAASK